MHSDANMVRVWIKVQNVMVLTIVWMALMKTHQNVNKILKQVSRQIMDLDAGKNSVLTFIFKYTYHKLKQNDKNIFHSKQIFFFLKKNVITYREQCIKYGK